MEELNSRMQSLDVGFMERNNRPVALDLGGESNDLGLLRNASLLFGDLVTSTDQHWGRLLLSLQILSIVLSPMLSQGRCVYLKRLIMETHKLFKMLYPWKTSKFKKKMYLLLCIQKIRPALHSWPVLQRYEDKTQFLKKKQLK